MENFRGFEEETGLAAAADEEPVMDAPPEIGVDERRMHVRAYNYWVSLLDGRAYPLIADLNPGDIEDFGPHSVLLDFSKSSENPDIVYLGRALRAECGLDSSIRRISQVPSRSLLSRLTDHYMQIIANSAPIGFEAEFVSHRGHNAMYRGILMPISSDGEEIDFIYGVINWKELADGRTEQEIAAQVDRAVLAAPAQGGAASDIWADGPHAEIEAPADAEAGDPDGEPTLSLWPEKGAVPPPTAALDADAGLGDHLSLARESAEDARGADHRSRAALYRALGHAYDFALAAQAAPDDYAELLDDAGIKTQVRAPMTPVVKLVFGAHYDKTRLTEFAAALSWAKREGIPFGAFEPCLEGFAGGLKAMVKAERQARRPAPRPDRAAEIRDRLRTAPAFAELALEADGEFVLLIGRRAGPGRIALLGPVPEDPALIDRALKRAAA